MMMNLRLHCGIGRSNRSPRALAQHGWGFGGHVPRRMVQERDASGPCCIGCLSEASETVSWEQPEVVLEQAARPGSDSSIWSQQPESQISLSNWTKPQLFELVVRLEQSKIELSPAARDGILDAVKSILSHLSPVQLSQVAWASGELGGGCSSGWAAALLDATAAAVQEEFLAPDLAKAVCAAAAQARQADYEVPVSIRDALKDEAYYQLQEFMGDFRGQDIARLLSGLADMGVQADGDMHYTIMRAVYHQLKSIEDKASVDFALAKMESDRSSLHYDPRWTYEEMGWLPRSERDKRRIISETWQKSQWQGY